jgi:hypothetical protein
MPGISPDKSRLRLICHRRALSKELLLRAVTGISFFTIRGATVEGFELADAELIESPNSSTINEACLLYRFLLNVHLVSYAFL